MICPLHIHPVATIPDNDLYHLFLPPSPHTSALAALVRYAQTFALGHTLQLAGCIWHLSTFSVNNPACSFCESKKFTSYTVPKKPSTEIYHTRPHSIKMSQPVAVAKIVLGLVQKCDRHPCLLPGTSDA